MRVVGEVRDVDGAKFGIVCSGTSRFACEESLDQLKREYSVDAAYLRLKAYPFTQEVRDFIARYDRVYVVDQNRDGQTYLLMKLDFNVQEIAKLRSVRHFSGMPIDARSVTDEIILQEGIV